MPLPFIDTFTDSDGEAWDTGRWTTSEEGSVLAVTDILSNRGQMRAGEIEDDFSTATANSDTDIIDGRVRLKIDPEAVTADLTWLYICLRSTGEQQSSGDRAGRPVTAYYVRFDIRTSTNVCNLYRRTANSESSVRATGTSRISNTEKFWCLMEVEDNGSNVWIRCKSWDDGENEPGAWDIEYNDSSPGILNGASGVLQLVTRNFNNATYSQVMIDDVTFNNLSARTTVIIDMEARKIRRITL